jgi:hypothetical protein
VYDAFRSLHKKYVVYAWTTLRRNEKNFILNSSDLPEVPQMNLLFCGSCRAGSKPIV